MPDERVDVLALSTAERSEAGLYLAMQYPTEVPGVRLTDVLEEAFVASGRDRGEVAALLESEADQIGFEREFLDRPLNVDLSGGEKKRNETVQMAVLAPRIAILDEIDSGLDIDALRAVSRRIELEAFRARPLAQKALEAAARLLSPLM